MSLLDKLIEKKDLDTYLRLRIRELKESIKDVIKQKGNEKDRERRIGLIHSRIKEICKLGDLIRGNKLKDTCKSLWRKFNLNEKFLNKDASLEKEVGKKK